MYKLDKDSEVAQVKCLIQAHYSGAIVYGEVYYPVEVYEDNKEIIESETITVHELDGKHSESCGEVQVEVKTLGDIIKDEEVKGAVMDISDNIIETIMLKDEYSREFYKELDGLNKKIKKLKEENRVKTEELVLKEDTEINGKKYSKGTEIVVKQKKNVDKIFVEVDKVW